MRRLFAWIAGAAGGLAAWRVLARRGRRAVGAPPPSATDADPRAQELRAKLAETGAAETQEVAQDAAPEPEAGGPGEEPAATDGPEERRRRVHEAGRAAIDEMDGVE
jgi:hypothetical protein